MKLASLARPKHQKSSRPGQRQPPARPRLLTDPATAVELARTAPRTALPHSAAVQTLFAERTSSLDRLEVHRGQAAREACDLLGARAFAVRNVVVFGEEHPALSRVAHEVAHAIQQGGDGQSAPSRFEPGSLAVSTPGSSAECEAESVAAGRSLDRLSYAPAAVYRDTERTVDDTEKLLLKMMKQEAYAPIDHKEKEKARFAARDATNDGRYLFRYSSPKPWRRGDLWRAAIKAGDKRATIEEAAKDVQNIFADPSSKDSLSRKGLLNEDDGITYRISKVDTGAKVLSLYVFIGDTFVPNANYYPKVFDLRRDDADAKDPEEALGDYREILKTIVKQARANKKAERVVTGLEDVIKDIAKALKADASTAELEEKASDIRKDMIEAILKIYPDLDELHDNIIATNVFGKYTTLQGRVFETWYLQEYGDEYNLVEQPVFADKVREKFFKSEKLHKVRRGDFAIKVGSQNRVRELKALSEPRRPGDEEKLQMTDYRTIFEEEIPGYFREGGKLVKRKFTGVDYKFSGFPDIKFAEMWSADLEERLTKSRSKKKSKADRWYTSTPNPLADPKLKVVLEIETGHSPRLTLDIEDSDTLQQHFDAGELDKPQSKWPGLTLKSVDIVLAHERDPRIASGTLVMDVDMGQQLTKQDDPKPIKGPPETEVQEAKPPATPAKAKPDGFVPNQIGGMASSLDRLLTRERLQTSVEVTDEGLRGTVRVTEGSSGIPGFLIARGTDISATLSRDKFSMRGNVALKHEKKDITGGIEVKWDSKSKNLTVTGKVTARKLIPVVDEIALSITYTTNPENLVISADALKFSKQLKGVQLEGSATKVAYDTADASVTADDVTLSATLALLGKVTTHARVEKNELTEATFEFTSATFQYPRDKKEPALEGKVDKGSVTYDHGDFSGEILGSAKIRAAALKKLSKGNDLDAVALSVRVGVSKDGSVSGYIRSDTPIPLGTHFVLSAVEGKLDERGDVSATATLNLVNLKLSKLRLDRASITCTIDKNGFTVNDVEVRLDFGTPKEDRIWGDVLFSYTRSKGFTVGAEIDVKIKKGLYAHGSVLYDVTHDEATATVKTGRIDLLFYKPRKPHRLFGIGPKQFVIFSILIGGVYFEIAFDLSFQYSLEFWVEPSITLTKFKLSTFTYESARATMTLGGELTAELAATPSVGLGLFLLAPMLLRGGGGLSFPIKGLARLLPRGTFVVFYSPDGDLQGGGSLGLALSFGITADLIPSATFTVLDGLYEAKWTGDSLKTFPILPERELFNYVVDFGKPLEKETNPALPSGSKEPAKPTVTKPLAQEEQRGGAITAPKTDQADASKASRDDLTPGNATGQEEGFDLKGMIAKLLQQPRIKRIKELIDEAVFIFNLFFGWILKLILLVKNWIGSAMEAVTEFLKDVRELRVFEAVKRFLKKRLSANVYYVVVPLLDLLASQEENFLRLIGRPLPTTPWDWILWTMETIKLVLNLSFGNLVGFVDAVYTMISRLTKVVGLLLNEYVQAGKLGVRRGLYGVPLTSRFDFYFPDEFKVNVGGFELSGSNSYTIVEPSSAVAGPLYLLLSVAFKDEVKETPGDPYYWRKEKGTGQISPQAPGALRRAARSSSGIPLPSAFRRKYASSLNTDLDDVRVHADGASASAAEALSARAYTVGRDIHFGAGEYRPFSPEGESLLAHEVVHAAQAPWRSQRTRYGLRVGAATSPRERAADSAARAMIAGHPAGAGRPALTTRWAGGYPAWNATPTATAVMGGQDGPESRACLRQLHTELHCPSAHSRARIVFLLGRLSDAARAEVLSDRCPDGETYSRRLRILDPRALRAVILTWRVNPAAQLRFLERHWGGPGVWDETRYVDIAAMLRAFPAAQKRRLHGEEWKRVFIRVCDHRTIVRAVGDLGLPEPERARWIADRRRQPDRAR